MPGPTGGFKRVVCCEFMRGYASDPCLEAVVAGHIAVGQLGDRASTATLSARSSTLDGNIPAAFHEQD